MHLFSLLSGIIVSGVFGLYIGNFATNPIYRLPRNEPIFIKDPYCGDCNARLVRRDLYPVLSWLLSRGRCRYCGASVPAAYAVTEALVGALFVICYLEYGFSEQFILLSLGMTSFVMLAMMLILDNFFSNITALACIVLGMLYQLLLEGTIYGFAGGGFAGLFIGAAIWRISGQALTRDVKAFPNYLKLLVAAGIWLSLPQLIITFVIAGIGLPLRKSRVWFPELIIITCIMVLLLTRILH
jgi:prepilin signal peptidase PulO-like enzyme (type II secretory pathway)